jgi:hypothetical protein
MSLWPRTSASERSGQRARKWLANVCRTWCTPPRSPAPSRAWSKARAGHTAYREPFRCPRVVGKTWGESWRTWSHGSSASEIGISHGPLFGCHSSDGQISRGGARGPRSPTRGRVPRRAGIPCLRGRRRSGRVPRHREEPVLPNPALRHCEERCRLRDELLELARSWLASIARTAPLPASLPSQRGHAWPPSVSRPETHACTRSDTHSRRELLEFPGKP